MSHADMNNCSGFNEVAAAFSWNSPKKAINPYLDPAEVAPVSALSNLITLYATDNEQEQLRREALSDQVCIVFSNSASLAFRGVRLTVNCDCWLVRRQGNRVTKKQVRRYWITRALMPSWLLLMLVVLPPTS